MTRIVLVDDHPMLLEGLAAVLTADSRIEVVGTGGTAADAGELVELLSPDVVILDIGMPGDVLGTIHRIATNSPDSKVMVFTASADPSLAVRALDAGAKAFVLKGSPSEDLIAALDVVQGGKVYISQGFAQRLPSARPEGQESRPRRSMRLSSRELQVLDQLLKGGTNREIGEALNLREKTIKHYMTNLMNKLGAKTRLEVVVAAQALVNEGAMHLTPGTHSVRPQSSEDIG
jgi:two-component system nitrate/nitrite response regulator NarL